MHRSAKFGVSAEIQNVVFLKQLTDRFLAFWGFHWLRESVVKVTIKFSRNKKMVTSAMALCCRSLAIVTFSLFMSLDLLSFCAISCTIYYGIPTHMYE